MKNPTLSDVATIAGVSYATADRVINNRGNVAEKSVRKVHEAMASVGYVRNVAAANLSRGRVYRLAFLLPQGGNAFFSGMREHLAQLAAHMLAEGVSVEIVDVAAFSAEALKDSLWKTTDAAFDGVAVVGLQSDALEAPLQKLREDGVAVVGLVSDLPQAYRAAYIGIDNPTAGRTAARLVGMSHGGKSGRVQVMAGSLEARDHAERLAGFNAVMREDFPHLDLLAPILTCDDAQAVADAAAQSLRDDPTITAVYNAGAGNRGLIAALRAHPHPKPFFCAVHELTGHSRQALCDGHIDLVIDQRPDMELNRALAVLRALIDARDPPPMTDLVPTIYVRDNLPADMSSDLMKDQNT